MYRKNGWILQGIKGRKLLWLLNIYFPEAKSQKNVEELPKIPRLNLKKSLYPVSSLLKHKKRFMKQFLVFLKKFLAQIHKKIVPEVSLPTCWKNSIYSQERFLEINSKVFEEITWKSKGQHQVESHVQNLENPG